MRRLDPWVLATLLGSVGCRAEVSRSASEEAVTTTAPADPAGPPAATVTQGPSSSSGTVIGEVRASGEPLAGAQVCVRRELPTLELVRDDIAPLCVDTDAAGRFEVKLDAGIYFVIASAEHYLPQGKQVALRADGPGVALNFELLPGGREYVGTVVDLEHQPIAGAKVVHVTQLGTRRHYAVEVETDERGGFRLWSTRVGNIRVMAPGYARTSIPERDGQRLVLLPESSIAGVVVDRDGRPVANARVATRDRGLEPAWGWPDHAVRTDAEGRFTLTQLAPHDHVVSALSPDRELGGTQTVHVGLGERREQVVITIDQELFNYRARIVDAETNAPVAACMAEWKYGDEVFGAITWVDEQGLLDVPLGTDELELAALQCPGYVARKPFPQPVPDASEPLRIEVHAGIELRGVVFGVVGGFPAGVLVSLSPTERELRDVIWPEEDTTDALGRFTITGLAPGRYQLGDGPVEIVLDERRSQEVKIPLSSHGRIEVEVGPDHAGRSVSVRDCTEYDYEARPWSDRAEVEPNGLAVIERAPTGAHRVSLDEPGTDPCGDEGIPLEISADETTRVRLEVGRERTTAGVRVRVMSPIGRAAAGAVVSVGDEDDPITPSEWTLTPFVDRVVITDAQGRATLPRQAERFTVVAARPGQFGARTIDAAAATQEIVIVLDELE